MPPLRDSWSTLTLRVPAPAEDILSDYLAVLTDLGSTPIQGAAHQGLDPDTGQDLWMIYTETEAERAALEAILTEACVALGLSDPSDHPVVVGRGIQLREPWHEAWREHFQPVDLGTAARIVPPWHRGSTPPDGPPEIVIDPGMAFGTGTHPTTQLALQIAASILNQKPGATVLDVGTGSAILSIAALKYGAGRVTGTDLDPDVAANVVDNLRLNDLLDPGPEVLDPEGARAVFSAHPRFRLHLGPLTDSALGPGLSVLGSDWSGPFDLILCNMLQHEFTPLLPLFPSLLRPEGAVVLSGFLARDLEELLQDLAQAGLVVLQPCQTQGDWGGLLVGRG